MVINYLFIFISLLILSKIGYIKQGEIGNVFFEILQMLYCIICFDTFFKRENTFFTNIVLLIFLVHLLRFILNYKKILSLFYNDKVTSILSLVYVIYLLINKFNVFNSYIFGLIYAYLAIKSLKKTKVSTMLFADIPVTFGLIFLLLNKNKFDNKIVPIILGDLIYHIFEIIIDLNIFKVY